MGKTEISQARQRRLLSLTRRTTPAAISKAADDSPGTPRDPHVAYRSDVLTGAPEVVAPEG